MSQVQDICLVFCFTFGVFSYMLITCSLIRSLLSRKNCILLIFFVCYGVIYLDYVCYKVMFQSVSRLLLLFKFDNVQITDMVYKLPRQVKFNFLFLIGILIDAVTCGGNEIHSLCSIHIFLNIIMVVNQNHLRKCYACNNG